MPATFSRYPVDIERKDTGMGGKPPVDRRPTGGGGGGDDNWEHRSSSRREPRALLTRYRTALVYALAADLALFVVIVGEFLVQEGAGRLDPSVPSASSWHALALPPILWINTALLLLSAVTMEMARRPFFSEVEIMEEWLGMGRPALRRAMPWLIATLILGGLFLAGQWMAWAQLSAQGFWSGTNPNSHFFYLITRVHALHLLLGIVALMSAVGSMFFIKRVMWRQVAIDCTAWYWHTMSALWLVLFAVLLYGP
ncbi:MAG: cytochrome c oxidase subunit 3 [Acidobacteria bacterium]|jgi:cytochrome c oxidase subunit 3|nr:cytochrome c oxidase subunit 3 [Acidobacteriota bacterium]